VAWTQQDLERRRIDAIRIGKYMDVMGVAKTGEPHPREAMVKQAHSQRDVKVSFLIAPSSAF
jgi:hypothetical protein